MLGQTIGHCRIEALLGSGGMGQVFRARHVSLNRLQAIKVMHEALARDPGFQARFSREAQSIAALNHDHIVEIYDFAQQDGRFFMSMELLPDGSLRTLLDRKAKGKQAWPLNFGLDLVRQAANALTYAHSKGMVHRDIKPDNMLLLRQRKADGSSIYTLKVSDFGLVQLAEGSGMTSSGVTVGTPAYMSPEQCQGLDLDGRSDIYALGVVLYEVLTGYLPFAARTISEAVRKHVKEAPRPPREISPDLPVALEALILRCLAKRPDERFATAADLAAALRVLIGGDAPRPLGPQLRLLDAQGASLRTLPLTSAGLTVGRIEGNDLVLDSAEVARSQLRVDWSGRRARVTDLGAKGSTYLADAQLAPHVAVVWSPEQPLRVGPYTLRLENTPTQLSVALSPGHEALTLTPGQPTVARVQITAGVPTSVVLTVEGLPAAWVQAPAGQLEVQPGVPLVATLPILVPATPEALAASHDVNISVRAPNGGPELARAPARWTVAPFAALRLTLDPEQASGRSKAAYTLQVCNDGNAPARYALSADDGGGALHAAFEPAEVEVAPGQHATVALTMQAARRFMFIARRRTFKVATTDGANTTTITGQFVQRGLVPTWLVPAR